MKKQTKVAELRDVNLRQKTGEAIQAYMQALDIQWLATASNATQDERNTVASEQSPIIDVELMAKLTTEGRIPRWFMELNEEQDEADVPYPEQSHVQMIDCFSNFQYAYYRMLEELVDRVVGIKLQKESE